MIPAEKTSEMRKFVDEASKDLFGRSRTESITTEICVTCGKEVKGFRDGLLRKEYAISGMCQECQDSVFG